MHRVNTKQTSWNGSNSRQTDFTATRKTVPSDEEDIV